jgi:TonB-dependent receptor
MLFVAAQTALADGTIKGRVFDKATKNGLPAANVVIKGTSIGMAADLNGEFSIPNAPSGLLTVVVSYVGYVTTSADVTVEDGKTVSHDFFLQSVAVEVGEMVVTAQAQGQIQAINQQLNSNKIVSVVSEARIQELPDFNAAQAISRLPGVSTLQSSGEANKVVIRGLAPQYNAVAVGGITLASTGSTQIGVTSQGGGSSVNTDRSVDLSMITPYMIKSIEVFKSLTPDMNANAIGGYVNMNLREAPEGFKTDFLFQSGYTQKSGKYGNYRIVGAASNRFLDDDLGVYVLANAEQYDRNADNMNASYVTQSTDPKADGFRPVRVTSVTLNRHVETRNRYGGNLILDYKLPSGSIKSVNVFSRLSSNSQDYRTILDYQTRNILFRYTEGDIKTDLAINSLEFTNDFGFMSAELKVANTYSRNFRPGSPQFDLSQTGAISKNSAVDAVPESLAATISYRGPSQLFLNNISLFSADYKENDQVYKGDFKVPFSVGSLTSGYFKFGGEFRYNLRKNDQGTPYAGIRAGSPISAQLIALIRQQYPGLIYDSTAATFPGTSFTSTDEDLNSAFLDNRFGGLLWVNGAGILDGITNLLRNDPSVSAVNSSSTNPGGWFDGAYQHLPNKYKYVEKYSGGYLMSELNFGQDLRIVGGIRWEEVNSLFDAFNLSDGRDVNTQVVDSVSAFPYNRFWLPMVQTRWNVVEGVDFRYSFTKTLARPDYHQLTPHFSMDYTQFNVQAGNPRLKPAEALNHDVFITYHSNELGLLSLGGFYKEITNFTFFIQYNLHPTAAPGLDSLSYYAVRSASGGTVNYITPKDGAQISTYVNSLYPAYVRGLELDFQTRFWYLPKPFDGTVFGVNYTKVWSQATYPQTKDTTLFLPPDPQHPRGQTAVTTLYRTREGRLINQPNDILNAYIGYDYEGFSGRVSILYQGNSVSGVGLFSEQDGFTKDYFRVDISARQKLPWFNLQLFLDINNVNNRKNESAQSSLDGFTSQQFYGMTANLGLRFTM